MIRCRSCMFAGAIRAVKRLRTDMETAKRIAKESVERGSVRILARRYAKGKNTVMRTIHAVLSGLPDSIWIARRFLPRWSGTLVFDGKVVRVYDQLSRKMDITSLSALERIWLHKMRWLVGIDHGTGDLPHYALHEGEGMIDLVLYFEGLKKVGYRLKALVSDGNPDIPRAARVVFGDTFVFQRCIRHFLEDLRRELPPMNDPRRALALEGILRIRKVLMSDTLEEALRHHDAFLAFAKSARSPLVRRMMQRVERHKEPLLAFLVHPDLLIPRTSNDAESLIKQLNIRLRTVGRFMGSRHASAHLNAWALLRRFTPFTDCRGARRHRNRKAPLELAGCHIAGMDPFSLPKQTP